MVNMEESVDDTTRYEYHKDMNITRCIKPNNFGEFIHCSIHYFSDACDTGYGMSAYIRLVEC